MKPPNRRISVGASRLLMVCDDCEKWYWADSGEEVSRLVETCATALIDPEMCYDEIREILNSGGSGYPRMRAAEFNWLCSDCPNARFMSGSVAVHADGFWPSRRASVNGFLKILK